jgi:hypothetical protein
MLRRAGLWTDLAVGPALAWLGADPSVGGAAAKVLAEAAAGTPLLTV